MTTTDAPGRDTAEQTRTTEERYPCPVCLWKTLGDPVRNHNICPCCATHFGLSDSGPEPPEVYHTELRELWLSKGGKWWRAAFEKNHPDCPPEWFRPIPEFIEGQPGGY